MKQSDLTKKRIRQSRQLKISFKKCCKKCKTKLYDLEKILGYCGWHIPNKYYGPLNAPNGIDLLSMLELKKRGFVI